MSKGVKKLERRPRRRSEAERRKTHVEAHIDDWPTTLDKFPEFIANLQKIYGVRAGVVFDAGYNNVSMIVTPTKKTK